MFRSLALIASLVVLTPPVYAAATQEVAAALKQGGYVIVFRHGATTLDKGNADPMGAGRGKSTSTERQLSPRGRQAARDIGGAFKTLHIPIGVVYTSQLERAVETGRLISDKSVTTSADFTEAGEHVMAIEKDRRAQAMLKIVATQPAKGTNTLLVSHKPNIVDAFGNSWSDVQEGEASIFRPYGNGKYLFVGRVQASEWSELAKRH
jgi:broad specificity phosphatase PhoE